MRRLYLTSCDCGQDIIVNDVFKPGRQRLWWEVSQVFNPSLYESFKFERFARWVLAPYRNAVELLNSLNGRRGQAGIGISINPSLFWGNQQPKRVLHGNHIPLQSLFSASKVVHRDLGFDDHEPTVGSTDYNVRLERHFLFPHTHTNRFGRLDLRVVFNTTKTPRARI